MLVLRLAFPAAAMPAGPASSGAGLLADMPICHTGDAPAPATPDAPPSDCALCPVCHLVAAPALLPPLSWTLPPPPVGTSRVALSLPPSTGPPLPERFAAPPRGPPAPLV